MNNVEPTSPPWIYPRYNKQSSARFPHSPRRSGPPSLFAVGADTPLAAGAAAALATDLAVAGDATEVLGTVVKNRASAISSEQIVR